MTGRPVRFSLGDLYAAHTVSINVMLTLKRSLWNMRAGQPEKAASLADAATGHNASYGGYLRAQSRHGRLKFVASRVGRLERT